MVAVIAVAVAESAGLRTRSPQGWITSVILQEPRGPPAGPATWALGASTEWKPYFKAAGAER